MIKHQKQNVNFVELNVLFGIVFLNDCEYFSCDLYIFLFPWSLNCLDEHFFNNIGRIEVMGFAGESPKFDAEKCRLAYLKEHVPLQILNLLMHKFVDVRRKPSRNVKHIKTTLSLS